MAENTPQTARGAAIKERFLAATTGAGANREVNAFDSGGRSFQAPFAVDPLAAKTAQTARLQEAQTAAEAGLRSQAGTDIQGAQEFGERSEAFSRARLGKIGGFEGTFGIALQNSVAARTEKTISGIKAAAERAVQSGRMELASRLADLEADQMETMVNLNKFAFDQFQAEKQNAFKERGIDIQESDLDLRQSADARAQKESEQDQFMQAFTNNSTGEVTALYQRSDGTTYQKSLGAVGQRTIFKPTGDNETDKRFNTVLNEEAAELVKLRDQGTLTDADFNESLNFLINDFGLDVEEKGNIHEALNQAMNRAGGGAPEPVDDLMRGLEDQVLPQSRSTTGAGQAGAGARQAANPLITGVAGGINEFLKRFAEPAAGAGQFTRGFLTGR